MYDLIILGAGPAGLSASIYASRYKINHLVIGNVFDGSLTKAHLIENWPGRKLIKGSALVAEFYEHAKSLGAEIIREKIVKVDKNNGGFVVKTELNKIYKSKTILIALGTKHRKLNISGEEEFLGKGISYCVVCDGVCDVHASGLCVAVCPALCLVVSFGDLVELYEQDVGCCG